MTEFIHEKTDTYLEDENNETNDKNKDKTDECVEHSDPEDSYLKSDSSSSGSWSIDDTIFDELPKFSIKSTLESGQLSTIANAPISLLNLSISPISSMEDLSRVNDQIDDRNTKDLTQTIDSWSIDDRIFDELPKFTIKSTSASGHLSAIANEPISLFNLSISPISSMEDLSRVNDQSDDRNTKDLTETSGSIGVGYDDDDRISLEDLTAQINTPPSMLSRSNKRLNLETIHEDVFFETPKKRKFKRFNCFNSWRIETFQEITNDERINSCVFEQQINRTEQDHTCNDTFCNAFDDKMNINNTILDD